MEEYNTGRFSTVAKAIASIMSREGDVSLAMRLRYTEVAKEVYEDLNLSVIKDIKRVVLNIHEHLPVLPVPLDYYDFVSLDYLDRHGVPRPMVFNDKLKDDVIDISLDHDCGCECGCTSGACCAVKNYETIQEQVEMDMPNSTVQTFTKYTRKNINPDGSYFQEVTEPVRVYDNNVWTDTLLKTVSSFICKLDVKECGCLLDTEHNRTQLQENCCGVNIRHECGCSAEYHKNSYTISQDGNRLILPKGYDYEKIVLRYFPVKATKDILIPRQALKVFMTGLKKEMLLWDKKGTDKELAKFESAHIKAVNVYRGKMSRMTLHEFYEYYYGRKLRQYRGESHNNDQFWDHDHYNNEI